MSTPLIRQVASMKTVCHLCRQEMTTHHGVNWCHTCDEPYAEHQ